ncbi:MAG TPA: DNA primase [Verrucomicrobiae bacterium]|nr:DNA primase [Verrucomicrobiae bacterium]
MAGFFSQTTLEQIRAASDIVEVIGSYIPLKRAGANFVALCPFHREKSPSFNVNPHLQIFHCFGCHKGGDVFSFVKEFESVDFPEAVRRLAERARIPLEYQQGGGDQRLRGLKEKLLEIHEQITQRWQTALANDAAGQVAREYLARRGVSAEAIELFRLGYAPDAWDDTVNWSRGKGYEPAMMERAGLILHKQESDRYYDRFRGRLMFPICDEQGRVIGFSGRVLAGDEKSAKYVNSPETPIFTKSKVFFGLDKSKRAVLEAQSAVVCEGQLDLIACFMSGVQNVVAPQGTAFTGEHARILKRYAEEVVLCFDSDQAGQNAAVRSLDHLLASGLAVRVAVIPSPDDPDSFIKAHGGAAFKKLIDEAAGFYDFYLDRLCRENDVSSDRGRLTVLREMSVAVLKSGNVVLIDKYAQKTALRLGVTPDAVRLEFKKASAPRNTGPEPDEEATGAQEEAAARPGPVESHLLKLLLTQEDLAGWAAAHLEPNWIEHPLVKQVVLLRLEAERNQTWQNLATFLAHCPSPEMQALITEATAAERPVPNPAQQLKDVALRLRNQFITRQMTGLLQQLHQPGISEEERLVLLRRQQELRVSKAQPFGG